MRTRLVLSSLVATVLGAAGPAAPQTLPLMTEQATTAREGTLVFETGLDAIADEPNYVTTVRRAVWSGPLLRLVYSPSDAVELDVEWIARVGVLDEKNRGDVQSSSWGDVTLRAKWRIVGGRGNRPTLGARFGVSLPQTPFEDTGFHPLGLGPNTLRAFAEALGSRSFGPLHVDLNAGLLLADEVFRPHRQSDFLSYGLAADWRLTTRLSAVAEWAGRSGDGSPGTDARSELRAGVRVGHDRFRGGLGLRRGLAAADGSWGLIVGVSWTWMRHADSSARAASSGA